MSSADWRLDRSHRPVVVVRPRSPLGGVAGCLLTVVVAVGVLRSVVGAGGTTGNIRQIFIGRCWNYQHVVNPNAFRGRAKDCDALWATFRAAFSFRPPCTVTPANYSKFVAAASTGIQQHNVMFWQRTYPFVHAYTALRRRGTALSDTLPGYMVNGLRWCGTVEAPGIDYTHCPRNCSLSAQGAFWKANSRQFASTATGIVRLMLNGSQEPAFRQDSVFAQDELPFLDRTRVSHVHALVVNDIGKSVKERCGSGTLRLLEAKVKGLGLKFNCTDNPAAMQYLLCVDNTHAWQCRMISRLLGHIPANRIMGEKMSSGDNGVTCSSLLTTASIIVVVLLSSLG